MEKLVEEIRELLVDGFYAFVLEKPKFKNADDIAISIISLILSAVRDGLELPGEVGRGEIVDGFMVDWDKEADEEPMGLNCRFIALSGTGTEVGPLGKEEEWDG